MIEIAVDVIKAQLLTKGMPVIGLTIDRVDHTILDVDPTKISEIIKKFFFLVRLWYFFLEKSLSLSRDFERLS